MKKLIVTLIVLCLATVASGRTDIFGDGREITLTYGDDVAQLHAGFMPFEAQDLKWGLVLSALLDDDEIDENCHVDSWMSGIYLEYPVLDVNSITPIPALESEVFAGVELQYAFGKGSDIVQKDNVYFTPYLGYEIVISKNLAARIRVGYNGRDDILDEFVLGAGVSIRW